MRKTILISLLALFSLLLAEKATIKVLAPNGGESFNENTVIAIRWQDDLPENVKIELVKETQPVFVISGAAVSNGSFDWTIPAGVLENSARYKIRIASTIVATINDLSDNFFTINATAATGTQVPAGNVSGIWNKQGSPYQINGDITVPTGSSLTIQAGVQVIFKGKYKMTVVGKMNATGTTAEPVSFTAANTETGWSGIYLTPLTQQTTDSSLFVHCKISRVVSEYQNNMYGIYLNKAKASIINSEIYNNSNGIKADNYSKLVVDRSVFHDNTEYFGITTKNSEIKCNNSLFYRNNENALDLSYNSIGSINNCTFSDNILCGIRVTLGSTLNLTNSILWNKHASSGYEVYSYSSQNVLNISNSVVKGGYWEFYLSDGIYNGYYQNNLESDPLFVNQTSNNYRLQPASPAINAGQQLLNMPKCDLDGNARTAYGQTDIGCYEFSSLKPVITAQKNCTVLEDNAFVLTTDSLSITGGHYPAVHTLELLSGSNYTASGNQITPAPNFNGNLTVNLRVYDGYNFSDPFACAVNILSVNDAPGINLPDTISMQAGSSRNWDCATFISDPDNNADNLHLTVSGGQKITTAVNGRKIALTAAADFAGTEKLKVTVNDQSGKAIGQDSVLVSVYAASSIPDNTISTTAILSTYPNPFNNTTLLNYRLAAEGKVKIAVYNAKGELVRELINSQRKAGMHSLQFNADNLNSGVYYLRLTATGVNQSTKLLLVK